MAAAVESIRAHSGLYPSQPCLFLLMISIETGQYARGIRHAKELGRRSCRFWVLRHGIYVWRRPGREVYLERKRNEFRVEERGELPPDSCCFCVWRWSRCHLVGTGTPTMMWGNGICYENLHNMSETIDCHPRLWALGSDTENQWSAAVVETCIYDGFFFLVFFNITFWGRFDAGSLPGILVIMFVSR